MEGINGGEKMEGMQEENKKTDMDDEGQLCKNAISEGNGKRARTTTMDGVHEVNGDAWEGEEYADEAFGLEEDEFIPECDDTMKPYIGQRFATVDDGVEFYKQYAAMVGFDVRCSTMRKTRDGEIGVKYLLCSREGHTLKQNEGSKSTGDETTSNTKSRRRVSNRVRCKARCGLRRQKDVYYGVSVFKEGSNHRLCSQLGRPFMKINRNMEIGHQSFIAACAKANIGTSKAFELYKVLGGGFDNIGATCVDFRNCKRDVNAHLHEADAQAIIDKYQQKQALIPNYAFDYDVDGENQLCRVFWVDPIAKQNYQDLGEMVSFDATYRTNRYRLVFVPFTGIDSHKKCVTFGAGLIAKEDIASYVWLLDAFKRCMGKTPTCIITDQDPAMKEAIPIVFPDTRHRFCMWHIMSKVSEKVGLKLAKNERFRKELNAVVWDETLGQEEFESKWNAIMEEYGLVDNRWFTQLFDVREKWIEAYFQGVFMGGLMRTTSRSEAENGVFGSCINEQGSLLEFFTQLESVIEMQRHKQARLVAETEISLPTTKTPLLIEKHASSVYTITVFYDVQSEIYGACFSCKITGKEADLDGTVYTIKEGQRRSFKVRYVRESREVECSCGKFNRLGILCRHVFVVLKDNDAEIIPPQYIVRRWTTNANAYRTDETTKEDSAANNTNIGEDELVAKIWSEFNNCMALAKGNTPDMEEMLNFMQQHKGKMMKSKGKTQAKINRSELVETFYGTQSNSTITVKPPQKAKNKGSGKRLKSVREKAVEKKKKEGRKCHYCEEQPARHDSRNCPLNTKEKK